MIQINRLLSIISTSLNLLSFLPFLLFCYFREQEKIKEKENENKKISKKDTIDFHKKEGPRVKNKLR